MSSSLAVNLDLVRDESRTCPRIGDPKAVATARIWHCGCGTLAPLAETTNGRSADLRHWMD